jgi:N-acetylglucosamine kinase-like BadF-type ATPase
MTTDRLIVAVDGGGSKTEFALSTTPGVIQESLLIEAGSNPNMVGPEESLRILKQGLEQLADTSPIKNADVIYLSIAGCAGKSRHNEFLLNGLTDFNKNIVLEGDLGAAYYSLTDCIPGALLIAGTGAGTCIYDSDGGTVFTSSAGYSASDLGFLLLELLESSNPLCSPELQEFCHEVLASLGCKAGELKGRARALSSIPGNLARSLANASNDGRFSELETLATVAANKWMRTTANLGYRFGLTEERNSEIVLSGSFWQWEKMREYFLAELPKSFPSHTVHYNPAIKQIEGTIKLAWKTLAENYTCRSS